MVIFHIYPMKNRDFPSLPMKNGDFSMVFVWKSCLPLDGQNPRFLSGWNQRGLDVELLVPSI